MITKFYILQESFNNGTISDSTFLESLDNFIGDYHTMLNYKDENKIYVQEDVFDIQLPNGKNLAEFIYGVDQNLGGKEKSLKSFLISIFSKLPTVKINLDEFKLLIKNNSIDTCVGLISMSKVSDVATENQIIYDTNSWYSFRRLHLGLFFGDTKYFVDECKKYFPNIYFHDNNYSSVGQILNGFSQKIIKHLEALHIVLYKLLAENSYKNHTELLSVFSAEAKLDERATLEGENKTRLKFKFINNIGKIEELVCEPHIKLIKNDNNDEYFFNRIYFHFGKESVQKSKILVAHIGEHL